MTSLLKRRILQLCAFVLAIIAGTSPFWLFNSEQSPARASEHSAAPAASGMVQTDAEANAADTHAADADGAAKTADADGAAADAAAPQADGTASDSADSSKESGSGANGRDKAVDGDAAADKDESTGRDTAGKAADGAGSARGAAAGKDKNRSGDEDDEAETHHYPDLEETVIEDHQDDARGMAGTIDIKGSADKSASGINVNGTVGSASAGGSELNQGGRGATAQAGEDRGESSGTDKKGTVSAGKNDADSAVQAAPPLGQNQKESQKLISGQQGSGSHGKDEGPSPVSGNEGKGEDGSAQGKGQSLEQKVKALTESQTREQKDAYERSLEERHELVETAIATIAENSRMYLPPLISSRALVVYFPAPSIDSRRTPNSSRVDAVTGAGSVLIDGKAEPAIAAIARTLSEESGARLYQINAITSYPKSGFELYDYALNELNTHSYPELTDDEPLHMDDYDTVYLCYPLWWDDLPGALYSFLIKYDLSDKNIIPVTIHAGDVYGSTMDSIATYEPNAVVYRQGLSFSINESLEDAHFTSQVRQFLTRLSTDFN